MGLVRIGTVVRAIGLKGQLGVAGTDGGLAALPRVALQRRGGEARPFEVVDARAQGKVWALQVAGVDDRSAAEGWVGAEVLADRADLGEPEEGRHYWGDLEGLPVETVTGAAVGRVTGLLETGAVDVLVVTGPEGEQLVPLAPYVTVDRAAGKVIVDPPEGLLELGRREGGEG